ncbi:MAG TPA: LysR substrate-binding domain-containing protein [Burkholderiaceae bacterium]|nr:LysR substrate-binding domain-containing protein [Burkholderiaceae bacterium]
MHRIGIESACAEYRPVIMSHPAGPEVPMQTPMLPAAARAHMGVAALPHYVAQASLAEGKLVTVLDGYALPAQEINAVYPSPKQVPAKVTALIAFLQDFFQGRWWERRL